MAHGRSTTGDSLPVEGSGEGCPGQRPGHTGQIFFVNGKNSLPTRESTDPKPVMAIFGGTTEIMKEIIARSLGL
jgi:hypothetical protein